MSGTSQQQVFHAYQAPVAQSVPSAVDAITSLPNQSRAQLQHHSNSTILGAGAGGMMKYQPGMQPMRYPAAVAGGGRLLQSTHLGLLPTRMVRPSGVVNVETETGTVLPLQKPEGDEAAQSCDGNQNRHGLCDSANWNRLSAPEVEAFGVADESSGEFVVQGNSAAVRTANPLLPPSPMSRLSNRPCVSYQGVFRHTTVSPTSIYNPGIIYPICGPNPACYPYWSGYPVPGSVSGNSPYTASCGQGGGGTAFGQATHRRQWNGSGSPSHVHRAGESINTLPKAGLGRLHHWLASQPDHALPCNGDPACATYSHNSCPCYHHQPIYNGFRIHL